MNVKKLHFYKKKQERHSKSTKKKREMNVKEGNGELEKIRMFHLGD